MLFEDTQMERLNQLIESKLMTAATCLGELNALNVPVLDINLNNAVPVLRVQPTKGLHRIAGAWCRSRRLEHGCRIDLMRGHLAQCFVEWEVRP
jgi:hypothetical protein